MSEFQKYCTDLDTSTKVIWRLKLLEFVLDTRNILKVAKEQNRSKEKEETLVNLIYQLQDKYFPDDGGMPISDSDLRDKFRHDLQVFRGDVKGAEGVKQGKKNLQLTQ